MPIGRSTHNQALLGPELFKKVRNSKVLVVGAGGIGCELLKNLVLVGFGNIEIIDLDTIDLSNLNRQFLFRKSDIKKSKALVASAFAHHFNPGAGPSGTSGEDEGEQLDTGKGVNIKARHGNIKEKENDVEWMKGFDLVMSALDNLEARRHVNKLCVAAGVPLIESGTQGYLGQVTPMQKDRTECFDCQVKPAPKTFPVCTIRATPSEPIHCIVWGKSYLFSKLFGEDDEAEDEQELEKAKANDENATADEIEELKKEAAAFREVRKGLGEEDGAKRIFEKVFGEDIRRLLQMEDMWKVPGRVKPVSLEYDSIMSETFKVPPLAKKAAAPAGEVNGPNGANGAGQEKEKEIAPAELARSIVGLKDQQELTIKANLELFIDSCDRLSARAIAHPNDMLSFDKDDDDTLDFVLATANLRAMAYGIPTKTRFEVKEMAGNIIPAIATTNAIISGYIVMRAINIISNNWKKCNNVFLKGDPSRFLSTFDSQPPEPKCGVCADVYVSLACDPTKLTLGTFVGEIVRGWMGWKTNEDDELMELAVYEDKRLLADPDFEDNYGRTLADLGVERGKMLTVADEDEKYKNAHFAICALPSDVHDKTYILPTTVPTIPLQHKPTAPVSEDIPSPPITAGTKRTASAMEMDDDFELVEPSAKRQKVDEEVGNGNGNGKGKEKNGDGGAAVDVEMEDGSDDGIEML